CRVGFLEDRDTLVKLVVLAGQLIDIVRDNSRGILAGGLRNLVFEDGEGLNDFSFRWLERLDSIQDILFRLNVHLCCFSQDGLYPRVRVLDKGTGRTLQLNRFIRVEQHPLFWVDLQQKELKGTESQNFKQIFR